jgi:hypothetical protein
MDRIGPAGCRENLLDLSKELQTNANSRMWTRLIAAAAGLDLLFYERLIVEACEAAASREP